MNGEAPKSKTLHLISIIPKGGLILVLEHACNLMYYIFFITIKTPLGRKKTAFSPTYYNDVLHYTVIIEDVCIFQMTRDESGLWKILAEELPHWVQEGELELNSLIETASTSKIIYLDVVRPHIRAWRLI